MRQEKLLYRYAIPTLFSVALLLELAGCSSIATKNAKATDSFGARPIEAPTPTPTPTPRQEYVWKEHFIDTYVVQPGDTLLSITKLFAQKYPQVSYEDLVYANRDIENINNLKVGQKIRIVDYPNN